MWGGRVCGGGGRYLCSNTSWVMVTWGHTLNRMTDTCENITFPQLRLRAVISTAEQIMSIDIPFCTP